MNKFNSRLMTMAVTVLLSISYASAATIYVTVDNEEQKPQNILNLASKSPPHAKQFPGTKGTHSVPFPNAVYNDIMIALGGTIVHCTGKGTSPILKKVDLDGDDKSLELVLKYNEDIKGYVCYEPGG